MKITKTKLKQIIKEELDIVMEEGVFDKVKGMFGGGKDLSMADQHDADRKKKAEKELVAGDWSKLTVHASEYLMNLAKKGTGPQYIVRGGGSAARVKGPDLIKALQGDPTPLNAVKWLVRKSVSMANAEPLGAKDPTDDPMGNLAIPDEMKSGTFTVFGSLSLKEDPKALVAKIPASEIDFEGILDVANREAEAKGN